MHKFQKLLSPTFLLFLYCLVSPSRTLACGKEDLKTVIESRESRPVELQPAGKEFSVSFVTNAGQSLTLKGNQQLEREIRLQIPSAVGGCFFNPGLSNFCYDNLDTLAVNMMSLRVGPFRFEPLAGKQVDYHDSSVIRTLPSSVESAVETVGPTRLIKQWLPNGFEIESFFRARVGARIEMSTYYDTPGAMLQQQGVAVRIKRWFQPGSKPKPLGSSLFFKIQRGKSGFFTTRNEFHLPIPENFDEKELPALIQAMAKKIIPDFNFGSELPYPKVHLFNQRIGFNLVFDPAHSSKLQPGSEKAVKVGFVVLDTFFESEKPLRSVGNGGLFESTSQMEIEVFDDEKTLELIEGARKDFQSFIQVLRSRIPGSRIDNLPKYVSAIKRLSRSRPRRSGSLLHSPDAHGVDFYSDIIQIDGIRYPYFAAQTPEGPAQLFSGDKGSRKAERVYVEESLDLIEPQVVPAKGITRIVLVPTETDNLKTDSLFFGSIENQNGIFVKKKGKWVLFAVPTPNKIKKPFFISHPTGRINSRDLQTLSGYKLVRPDIAKIEFDSKNPGVGRLIFL